MTGTSANLRDGFSSAEIAALIDHTQLKPEATRDAIRELCRQAIEYRFASVCVNPWYVSAASEFLRGSSVKVGTVAGFPLGATLPQVKAYEAKKAIELGAHEVDMVLNVGALKSGDFRAVEEDIRGVVETCHWHGAICKVILEAALLTGDEKERACEISRDARADFVKTSTGFAGGGATAEDVALIRAVVGPVMGVKAAGGIRRRADLEKMVRAGATRIGTSSGIQILREAQVFGTSRSSAR